MEPVVHFRGAVCLLGRFPALAGVDLDVTAGEIVLLQGPNGAGKTTLLRACAGLVPVVAGTARVLDHDLTVDRRTVRPQVGLLGHSSGLYDDLTAADNVRFWAKAGGATPTEADAALTRLGLDGPHGDVTVARLSAGQRRRASLAALIARRPQLWLLDEPHAALDQAGRDVVDDLIRDAVAAGATVLLASHELDRATAVAHRSVTVVGGIVQSDSRLSESTQSDSIQTERPTTPTSDPSTGPSAQTLLSGLNRISRPSTSPRLSSPGCAWHNDAVLMGRLAYRLGSFGVTRVP